MITQSYIYVRFLHVYYFGIDSFVNVRDGYLSAFIYPTGVVKYLLW